MYLQMFHYHPNPGIFYLIFWAPLAVLETKAGPSVRDRQLLVRTRNFLHISLQINVWISQNYDQDRQLFQQSPEHWPLARLFPAWLDYLKLFKLGMAEVYALRARLVQHVSGLMQDCNVFNANALEILQSFSTCRWLSARLQYLQC